MNFIKHWLKPIIGVIILLSFILVLRLLGFDHYFATIKEWISKQGIWAPIIFIGIYALAVVFAIPASILTIAAGAMFGPFLGVICALVGALIGASLSFLIARYIIRDSLVRHLNNNIRFQHLETLTQKNGSLIIAITRLIPLFPFTLLNYGFGLTNISFSVYLIGSAICMIPGTVLYVVGANVLFNILKNGDFPWLLACIMVIILALLGFIIKQLKLKIKN